MRAKKAPSVEPVEDAPPIKPPATTAIELMPPDMPPTEAEILAEQLLVQYLKLVKTRAEMIDQGKIVNLDTMNALKMVQETLWMLHGIGVIKR